MSRKIKFIIGGLIAIVILWLVLGWYQRRKDYRFSWEQPEFASIERGDLVIPLPATGSIEPASRTEIKCKASGTLSKLYVAEGDIVKKGELLLKLDPVDEQRNVDNAKAEVERAKANLKLSESEASKIARNWPVQLQLAFAGLEAARAELQGAVVNFSRMDNIRRNVSPEKASFEFVDKSKIKILPFKDQLDDPLIKKAATNIALAELEAKKSDKLVEYGKKILDSEVTVEPWMNVARIEYQNTLIALMKAQSNILASAAKVKDAVNSKVVIYQAKTKIQLAKEMLRKANVVLDQANQRLEETQIYSPIDGIIEKVNIMEGQIISSGITTVTGGTTLMIIADVSKLYVEADVDEADIGRVRDLAPPGKSAKLSIDGGENNPGTKPADSEDELSEITLLRKGNNVNIAVDAFRDEVFTGKVDRVYPHPKNLNNVVTYSVRILLTSDNKSKLMLGMHANIKFTSRKRKGVLLVDIEAIKTKNEEHGVYVKGDDGKPLFVPLKLGPSDGMKIELKTDKLKEGQKVYTKLPKEREDKEKEE